MDRSGGTPDRPSSSDRRRNDGRVVYGGILISVGIHVLVLLSWPVIEIVYEPERRSASTMSMALPILELRRPAEAPVSPLPPPPEASEAALETPTVVTPPPELRFEPSFVPQVVGLPSFEEALPPPVPPPTIEPVADEWSTYEPVTAATVQPDIRNRAEVRRFLERRYQPILTNTGATGSAVLRFWIDEGGTAQRILMVASSGNDRLDELAISVAEVIRFRAAVQEGKPIRVIVDVPIRFQAALAL